MRRGLQVVLAVKTLEYVNYMVSFESLFRDIKTTNLNTLQNETVKFKLLHTASSLDTFKNNNHKSNLSETELRALNYLTQSNDVIIQKADKANSVVAIDKNAYKKKMNAIISARSKFEKLDI